MLSDLPSNVMDSLLYNLDNASFLNTCLSSKDIYNKFNYIVNERKTLTLKAIQNGERYKKLLSIYDDMSIQTSFDDLHTLDTKKNRMEWYSLIENGDVLYNYRTWENREDMSRGYVEIIEKNNYIMEIYADMFIHLANNTISFVKVKTPPIILIPPHTNILI
jgi:hypothetical protein